MTVLININKTIKSKTAYRIENRKLLILIKKILSTNRRSIYDSIKHMHYT